MRWVDLGPWDFTLLGLGLMAQTGGNRSSATKSKCVACGKHPFGLTEAVLTAEVGSPKEESKEKVLP